MKCIPNFKTPATDARPCLGVNMSLIRFVKFTAT
jgi:hypothetical protein